MPDREKVIMAIEICIKSGCKDGIPNQLCPYSSEVGCDLNQILADALELLKEQDIDLQEERDKGFNAGYEYAQKEIVRCKDCKYWSAERINDFNKCRRWINVGVKNFATMGDWFCADGVAKDKTVLNK